MATRVVAVVDGNKSWQIVALQMELQNPSVSYSVNPDSPSNPEKEVSGFTRWVVDTSVLGLIPGQSLRMFSSHVFWFSIGFPPNVAFDLWSAVSCPGNLFSSLGGLKCSGKSNCCQTTFFPPRKMPFVVLFGTNKENLNLSLNVSCSRVLSV